MTHFEHRIESREEQTDESGQNVTIFELVVRISDSVDRVSLYPMKVKYVNGMVLHDTNKLKKDFSNVSLRRNLIMSMKKFVKSQVI